MLRHLALITLPLLLIAQEPWQGIVTDPRGSLLAYTFIHNLNQDLWEITNERGEFSLRSSFSEGDTLEFSRIGFKSLRIRLRGETRYVHVTLRPDPVLLEPVSTEAERFGESSSAQFGRISKTATLGNIEHRQLLSGISGLSIRSYGGPAGISTLSLDGGPAAHTKVIVSGFDITSAQNGEMDVSQLPVPFVESVTYIPREAILYGSGASDGVIYLDPWDDRTALSISFGSYGHQSVHGSLTLHRKGSAGTILLGKRHDDGNFPVSWRDKSFDRRNNQFDQQFAALQFRGVAAKQMFFRFLHLHSFQDRGVAGQVWSPDLHAHRDDTLQVTGLTLGWVKTRHHGRLQLMHRRSLENYTDNNPFIDSRHRLSTWHVTLKEYRELNERTGLEIQVEVKREHIASSDTDGHSRTTAAATLTIPEKVASSLEIRPTLRHDFSPNLYRESTYDLDLILNLKLDPLMSVAIHRNTNFRYPTFNDLYWTPGGNPDVKPEHSTNTSAQLVFLTPVSGDLRVQLFRRSSRDLIQWMPTLNYWQPVNIRHAKRRGWKMTWRWFLEHLGLSGFVNYSHIKSEDQTAGEQFGKPLRYAPENSSAFSVDWKSPPWASHLQAHYTGERISMYSWPKDVILPEVTVVTVSTAYTWKKSSNLTRSLGHELTVVASIDNLLNVHYETILGYPEPGRTFRFTLTYTQ